MDQERRREASVGARMRGLAAGTGAWGVWGGAPVPAAVEPLPAPALPKVLVASDAADTRQACREALSVFPCEVVNTASGAEALRLARAGGPALVLLDPQLPDMSGFELATLLKEDPRSAAVPLIFTMPAGASPDSARSAYRAGAVDCIVATPLDAEILRQKVRVFFDLHARDVHLRATLARAESQSQQLDSVNRKLHDQLEIIRQQATHDLLTGLPSRVLLEDRLDGALKRAARNKQRIAVAWVDLDGFKQVNELHGHTTGDELIVTTGQRLLRATRSSDTVARLGADEFAVVLEGLNSAAAAEYLGQKMVTAVMQPCTLLVALEGKPVDLAPKASIGLAIYPDHGQLREELVAAAETAMYRAKRSGGGVQVHQESAAEVVPPGAAAVRQQS